MAKIKNVVNKNLPSKLACVILISLAGILLYVALQVYTDSMYQYYSRLFTKGQIAENDLLVNNSVDIYDEKATENLRLENANAVLPVFYYSMDKTLDSIGRFDSFKKAFSSDNQEDVAIICGDGLAKRLYSADSAKIISFSYEALKELLEVGYYNTSEIQMASESGYSSICVIRDVNDSTVSIDDNLVSDLYLRSFLGDYFSDNKYTSLSLSDFEVIFDLVSLFIQPNVTYDSLITLQRRKVASDSTSPVYISFEKGQVLLAKDRVITDEQLHLISLLGNSSTLTVGDIVGESAFIILAMVFAMYLLCFYIDSEKLHSVQYLWIITVSLIITCVTAFFTINKAISYGVSFVESFVPVCFVPVLITMITGKREFGFISSLIVGLLMSATPGSTYLTFIYCTLNGILSSLSVRFFNKRTDMFIQWVITLAITSAMTALFVYIGFYANREYIYALIGNAFSVTCAHVLIAIILPILERVFNLPTSFRLNELAYGNNPLLSKLSDSAPGTYSHSKLVSELAEAASKQIGANAVLARVGGLYHDIGKTEHPEYFVENQSGANKHQDLNPNLSVSIIKSHVKIGADMARESGLPLELIDIIANHHGNDIIAYFYNEAKKHADDDDIISSTDFSYSNSSIPSTKECAVVMLADSIEAAARTIAGPTTAKFTKLINSIVYGKIERGQLDNCDLSMKEVESVKESFLKTLSAQYHNRIEYPDEEEEK